MPRAERTLAEAEAWEAGRDACIAAAQAMARDMRMGVEGETGESAGVARSNASTLDMAVARMRTLRP